MVLGSTRYSPPWYPPVPHHPGYTPMPADVQTRMSARPHSHVPRLNMAVGLKSVGQLSLYAQISDIGGMTEVYNLVRIDRINNHFLIVGND